MRWPALPSDANSSLLALLKQLMSSQWLSSEQIAARQQLQFAALLKHAKTEVPFYRDRFPDSRTAADTTLEEMPLLTRTQVQEAGETLQCPRPLNGHDPVRSVTTSGSTGRPVTVKTSYVTWLLGSALNMRFHLWHKRDNRARVANIRLVWDHQKEKTGENKPGPWAYAYPSGDAYTFGITQPVDVQYAWLQKIQPHHLLTHPSNLRALIEHARSLGSTPEGLREVITISEMLDPDLRDLCRSQWGVPLTDSYSAQETGLIAVQCPETENYHAQSESLIVEVLKDDGTLCGPGEIGRVVVTTLSNFVNPLIRYEIGDYAEVGDPCPCGRGLPVLRRILGRTRNLLVLPDGSRVWPHVGLSKLREIAPVTQAQMIQLTQHDLELNLVPAGDVTEDHERKIRDHVRQSLGIELAIEIKYVDAIPRGASGKYEDFMTKLA